jgi:8-oxo-dGTP pyrophosphatase MutT (NUDIX family)
LVWCDPKEEGLQVLFIQRPQRRGDRWSGDVAFPGGLSSPTDAGPVGTARREAFEEVGIALGDPLALLPPVHTLRPGRLQVMRVWPVVFVLDDPPDPSALRVDADEVAAVFAVPLERLRRRPRWVRKTLRGRPVPVPGLVLPEGRILWGLTLSMVRRLMRTSSELGSCSERGKSSGGC